MAEPAEPEVFDRVWEGGEPFIVHEGIQLMISVHSALCYRLDYAWGMFVGFMCEGNSIVK